MMGTKIAGLVFAAAILGGGTAHAEEPAVRPAGGAQAGGTTSVTITGAAVAADADGDGIPDQNVTTFTFAPFADPNALPTSQFVMTVMELNMTPEFTLSAEEKKAINAARTEQRTATIEWQKKNTAALKQLQEQLNTAAAAQDQQAMTAASKAMNDLQATAPSSEALDTKVKAALTEEHRKAVADKIAAVEADAKRAVIRLRLNGNVKPMPAELRLPDDAGR